MIIVVKFGFSFWLKNQKHLTLSKIIRLESKKETGLAIKGVRIDRGGEFTSLNSLIFAVRMVFKDI